MPLPSKQQNLNMCFKEKQCWNESHLLTLNSQKKCTNIRAESADQQSFFLFYHLSKCVNPLINIFVTEKIYDLANFSHSKVTGCMLFKFLYSRIKFKMNLTCTMSFTLLTKMHMFKHFLFYQWSNLSMNLPIKSPFAIPDGCQCNNPSLIRLSEDLYAALQKNKYEISNLGSQKNI